MLMALLSHTGILGMVTLKNVPDYRTNGLYRSNV